MVTRNLLKKGIYEALTIDEGLSGCNIVYKATKAYRSEMDVISVWIEQCCIIDVNTEGQSSVL
jgi:hypothetical protein